jgi:hypothetical protein
MDRHLKKWIGIRRNGSVSEERNRYQKKEIGIGREGILVPLPVSSRKGWAAIDPEELRIAHEQRAPTR